MLFLAVKLFLAAPESDLAFNLPALVMLIFLALRLLVALPVVDLALTSALLYTVMLFLALRLLIALPSMDLALNFAALAITISLAFNQLMALPNILKAETNPLLFKTMSLPARLL